MKIIIWALGLAFCVSLSAGGALAQTDVYTQASNMIDKRDYKGAIALLDTYLNAHPADARYLVLRGDAKDDTGVHIAALVDYDAAIRINPNYAYAYATRAGTEMELGRYDAASTDATKALALDPNQDMALRVRAISNIDLGKDSDSALADAKKAVSIDNSNPYNYNALCRAEYTLKMYPAALKDCNTGTALDPQNDSILFTRGLIYFRTSAWQSSIADFRRTLQIDNTNTNAYYWIAQSEYQLAQYAAALQDANAYVNANANDGDGLLVRARIKVKTGDIAGARDDGNQALKQFQIVADDAGAKDAQDFLSSLPKP